MISRGADDNSIPNTTDSNDIIMESSQLPLLDSSQHHNPVDSQLPLAPGGMEIASLCQPNTEDPIIRQPQVSKLYSADLNTIEKRSWVNNSTCAFCLIISLYLPNIYYFHSGD